MIRLTTNRFIILALAFPMLMPAGSAFASLMTISYPEPIEIDWVSTESTPANVPAPEAPNDQMPSVWNMIYGAAGSMESSVSSSSTHVTNCHFMTVRCFVPEKQCNELYLTDFQFIPETKPDAREKPPKFTKAAGLDFLSANNKVDPREAQQFSKTFNLISKEHINEYIQILETFYNGRICHCGPVDTDFIKPGINRLHVR